MFSQWLGEQDELFKFISSPLAICEPQPTIFMQQNEQLLLGEDVVNNNPSPLISNNVDPSTLTNGNISKPKNTRKRKSATTFDNLEENPKDYIKKIIHRDVERQRRQEMAGLYHNLRSLIPSAHLEGKRSISDHINGTVKYIMHMKNKIEELKNKREKLKRSMHKIPSSSSGGIIPEKSCPDHQVVSDQKPVITVKNCRAAGMEITVNTGTKGGDLSLSQVLKILISEGMSIKSCISTRVHERQLHVIQSEVMNGEKIIDPDELYKKLMGTSAINIIC
ncbi:OLC1v1029469C1 [Oldenlandia corymbosa var. corymbosa]|uniref:OLC1v1029469C1 n=1 Tax=Oldenlandia corymbosa var. corymbosa TaxID=529605 RepID=A0AAV1CEM5_OLDCO|nr:OLC1v1029469C1 [Oldenlandia corymbosa var. corymbosa]